MKAYIILSDAAVVHPDNTFSLLRGGIDRLNVTPGAPVVFNGAIIDRTEAEISESGEHEFRLCCINEDGIPVGLDLKGKFNIAVQGGSANLVGNLNLIFPNLGTYSFRLTGDRQDLATAKLTAVEVKPK